MRKHPISINLWLKKEEQSQKFKCMIISLAVRIQCHCRWWRLWTNWNCCSVVGRMARKKRVFNVEKYFTLLLSRRHVRSGTAAGRRARWGRTMGQETRNYNSENNPTCKRVVDKMLLRSTTESAGGPSRARNNVECSTSYRLSYVDEEPELSLLCVCFLKQFEKCVCAPLETYPRCLAWLYSGKKLDVL